MRIGVALMVVLAVVAVPAAADPVLKILPASTSVGPGDTFDVDVMISGLGAPGPTSVSMFDLTLSFNSAVLTATGAGFGLLLGDPALFEATTDAVPAPGSINIAETSFLSAGDLETLQPDTFTLATLHFLATGLGATNLTLVPDTVPGFPGFDVTDGLNVQIPLTAQNGAVDVTGVPEPGAWALLGSVCGIVAWRRRVRP